MKEDEPSFYFLSNHAHVLLVIARDNEIRVRDIADAVGITQRAVQNILSELEEKCVIVRERNGRRSRYRVNRRAKMQHELESKHNVGELIDLLA